MACEDRPLDDLCSVASLPDWPIAGPAKRESWPKCDPDAKIFLKSRMHTGRAAAPADYLKRDSRRKEVSNF